jgi:hypothetical protein
VRNEMAAALRAREGWALDALREALQLSDGSLAEAADLVGLAGASSIWRIAYAVPEVKAVIAAHGRRRGKKTT